MWWYVSVSPIEVYRIRAMGLLCSDLYERGKGTGMSLYNLNPLHLNTANDLKKKNNEINTMKTSYCYLKD